MPATQPLTVEDKKLQADLGAVLSRFPSLREVVPRGFPGDARFEISVEKMQEYSDDRTKTYWHKVNLPLALHAYGTSPEPFVRELLGSLLRALDEFCARFRHLPGARSLLTPLWKNAWQDTPEVWSIASCAYCALCFDAAGITLVGFERRVGGGPRDADITAKPNNGLTAHVDVEAVHKPEFGAKTEAGPLSVRSAKAKGGVRYVNFGCTSHSSRGGSICSNASTISEKKITEALIGALHEVLSGPEVQEAFARAFARRVGERTKADKPADTERQLAAAQRWVANATRLLVDDPDDLDLRRQREMDRAEVRRLEAELAERETTCPLALPDMGSIRGAVSGFLDSLSEASERGREALARCMSPLILTPKTNGPGRFEASGTIDLATVVASGSSGGRI